MNYNCEWRRKLYACEANVRRFREYEQLYDKGMLECNLSAKKWFHAITRALYDLSHYGDDVRTFIVEYYNLDGKKSSYCRKPIGIYGELHFFCKSSAYSYRTTFLSLVYAYASSEDLFDTPPRPTNAQ